MADGLVRHANIEDFETIFNIWMERPGAKPLKPNHAVEYRDSLFMRLRIDHSGFGTWVYEDETGQILGWQSLAPFRANPAIRNSMAEFSMYVSKKARNSGVGRKLMAATLAHADRSQLEYVIGYVAEPNIAMLHICGSQGFTRGPDMVPSDKNVARGILVPVFYRCKIVMI